jgi:hypothetical protein
MTKYDDVNTPVIAAIGLLAVLGLVAFVLLLQVFYYRVEARIEQSNVIGQPPVELVTLETQQQGRLASYAWDDAKKKFVAIPIDRAMDLVLADLSRGGKEADRAKK